MFFHNFLWFFGGLWTVFGVLLEPLSSLWLSGVILLGAFGSPGLSVDPLCYESARAMLFLFILLNALPVPMLRQVFLDLQNRAPRQVKLTFSEIDRFFRFFVFFKIDVLPAWELMFRVFYVFFFLFFSFFVFWGAPQK